MLKTVFKSPTALFYAIVVHAALIAILVFSMDWSALKENKPEVNIVDAVAVDEKKILKQIEGLQKIEREKKRKEDRRQKKLKDEALKAKKARERDEKKLAELKKKQKDENKRLDETKKQLAETKKKRLAEQEKRKKIENKRKAAEKKLAKVRKDKQRLEEAAAKRKEQARQKRIADLERRLKQEDKQRRADEMAAEVDERDKQMEAESKQLSEQHQKQVQSVTAKYTALIKDKIERSWRKPASAKPGMKSTVSVRLIPGGDVILVATIKSSGDALFDRSVETAVHRAVPLPLPEDPDLFEYFRELSLEFDPEK